MGGACSETDVDCSLVLCAPDQILSLELIADGTDVLAEGIYRLEDISLTGDHDALPEFAIRQSEFGGPEALLEIRSADWSKGSYTYTLELGNDWLVELEVDFTSSTDPCCGQSLIIRALTSGTAMVEEKSGYFTIVLT